MKSIFTKKMLDQATKDSNEAQRELVWEAELKLYLTSAGDRRRTIAFVKKLLVSEYERGYQTKVNEIVDNFMKTLRVKCKHKWILDGEEPYTVKYFCKLCEGEAYKGKLKTTKSKHKEVK